MQNEDGGFENDCSIARLAENHYMLTSPSIQQMRSYAWMKSHLPKDKSIHLQDVTSLYTTLCLMGPESMDVLEKVTGIEGIKSTSVFPYYTFRHIDVGCAPDILVMNITHTGESGCLLYIPNEFALHVFELLVEAGEEHGIKQCGYYAMRALRIEKFYAFWGQDLDSQSTPADCGRSFRVKLDTKIDFIGKDALKRIEEEGRRKQLVMLLLDPTEHDNDTDPWPWGKEPIFRDGKYVGSVTTTSYGFSLERHVAIGFVHDFDENGEKRVVNDAYVRAGDYEIEIAGIRYPATVRLTPPVLKRFAAINNQAAN